MLSLFLICMMLFIIFSLAIYILYQHYNLKELKEYNELLLLDVKLNISLIAKICEIYEKTQNFNNILDILQKFYEINNLSIIEYEEKLIPILHLENDANILFDLYSKTQFHKKHSTHNFKKNIYIYNLYLYDNKYMLFNSSLPLKTKDLDNIILIIPILHIILKHLSKEQLMINNLYSHFQ